MNIALGSGTLIRMAKLGCGALGSGFIASHHARAKHKSADSAQENLPRKGRVPEGSPVIRHRCRYAMNTTTTAATTATMMLIAVGQSIKLEVQRFDELHEWSPRL